MIFVALQFASFIALGQNAPKGLPPLIIKQVGERPVACLPEGETPLPLLGAIVSTLDGDWPPDQWAIVLRDKAKAVTLKAGECVAYRAALPGYKQMGADQPLKVGETYSFAIRRTDSANHWADGLHLGVFCIDQQPGGALRIQPYVQHDDDTVTYPRCGKYIGWKAATDGIIPPGYPSITPSS